MATDWHRSVQACRQGHELRTAPRRLSCYHKYVNPKHARSCACVMQLDPHVCYITCTNQLLLSGEQTCLETSMPQASHQAILLIQQILTFSLCSPFRGISHFLFTFKTVNSCLPRCSVVCLAWF